MKILAVNVNTTAAMTEQIADALLCVRVRKSLG